MKPAVKKAGFFSLVYQVVEQIPLGRVMTYGQIAASLGGQCSGRVVGFALRTAPADRRLPCHRVVNRNGGMSPIGFGGPGNQRRMLESEGVRFRSDGTVDLEQSQMPPFRFVPSADVDQSMTTTG